MKNPIMLIRDEAGVNRDYEDFRSRLSEEVVVQLDRVAEMIRAGRLASSSTVNSVGEGTWLVKVKDQGAWKSFYLTDARVNAPKGAEFFMPSGPGEALGTVLRIAVGGEEWNTYEQTYYQPTMTADEFVASLADPVTKLLLAEVIANIRARIPTADYSIRDDEKSCVDIHLHRGGVDMELKLFWSHA